jgi:hypothetical protein
MESSKDPAMFCIVTCLFPTLDLSKQTHDWLELVDPIMNNGIPTIIYTTPDLELELKSRHHRSTLIVRELTNDSLFEGLWLYEDLIRASERIGMSEVDRIKRVLSLRSLGWIHDESVFNPFGVERFLWINQNLLDYINSCYLSNKKILGSIYKLLNNFLLLYEINAIGATKFSDSIFGSHSQDLSMINSLYWASYNRVMDSGILPNFDLVIRDIVLEKPYFFDRFRLQSNGLEGVIFEAIRNNRVALEEIYISHIKA